MSERDPRDPGNDDSGHGGSDKSASGQGGPIGGGFFGAFGQGGSGEDEPSRPGGGAGGSSSGGSGGSGGGSGRSGGSGPRRPGGRPAGGLNFKSPLVLTIVALLGLAILAFLGAQLWTDYLWYDSVGFTSVWTTTLLVRIALFVAGAAVVALLVWSSLHLGYKHRPIYAPSTPEQQSLDRYREMIDPMRKALFIGAPALLGLFAGTAAAAQWQTFLLWWHREPFGVEDPQFGMDIGFFVFTLPWLSFVVGFVTMALALALIAAGLTHYVYGGVTLQGKERRTTKVARNHLAILAALLLLTRAGAYWLDRYDLVTNNTPRITGMTYTDVHAVLPTKAILAAAALMVAALFVATLFTRSWRLPLVGTGLLLVTSLLVGQAYPAAVQQFKVRPSEESLERPYIDRAIQATLEAYDLDDVEVTKNYQPDVDTTAGQLREDAETVPGIRLIDPAVVGPTFQQIQAIRNFYQFPDALDVGRYDVDGETKDVVISAREMDLSSVDPSLRNWTNDATVYTHGFGVVAAYGNQRGDDGNPVFAESNIPSNGVLGEYEPRIYFGEMSPQYSIVGAPEGSDPVEFDRPDDESGQVNNTYTGDGGVDIGSFPRQMAYALKYQEVNILLSDRVGSDSKMLDHRTPRERVGRVAPWLTLDGNAYPAVVDGRVQWILDGYTTSRNYPYSQLQSLGDATTDSLTDRSQMVQAMEARQINYVRNSVKATVDAYDGTVKLYAWDEDDPILKAWSKAFDNTVEPMSQISGDLMQHLRYPEDLFKIQREVLRRYHVDDPSSFFNGTDFWNIPGDPTQGGQRGVQQPPYYLSIAMPDQDKPQFSLTSTFIPAGGRQVMAGFAAVDSDAGNEDGKRRDGYGQIRLLELPRNTTVRGPGQVQNDIESSPVRTPDFQQPLSQYLNLNREELVLGNLLTVPVGGGMLYVEPVYVRGRGTGGTAYPKLNMVIVGFGDKVAWASTLDGALDELFDGDSGASAGDQGAGVVDPGETGAEDPPPGDDDGATDDPTGDPTDGATDDPTDGATGGDGENKDLDEALKRAEKAYEDGQDAMKRGDWEAYGKAQEELGEALGDAMEASPEGGSAQMPSDGATDGPTGDSTQGDE